MVHGAIKSLTKGPQFDFEQGSSGRASVTTAKALKRVCRPPHWGRPAQSW